MDGQDFYQQPVEPTPVAPQENKPGKGLAIGGLICGIASILLSCCYCGFLGIPGLIMGIIANKKNKSGLAIAAIITSVIGLVLFVISLIMTFALGASFMSEFSNSYYYY